MEEAEEARIELHPAITPARTSRYSNQLTEEDVFSLCDIFLTPGIHYVTFAHLDDGRRTMASFIDVLSCYRAIGYIDNVSSMRYKHGMNIYDLFKHCREQSRLQQALQEFFLDSFDYDFIWMVQNRYRGLRLFNWTFLNEAIEARVDQHLPIICIGADR